MEYEPSKTGTPLTSTPVKSQIIIASSKEMPPSSDESDTVDVCGPEISKTKNPFGDMNVFDIPIEIVDDFNDISGVDVTVTEVQGPPICLFTPLSDEDWVSVAIKFSLVINSKSHPVTNFGIGKVMSNPPTVSISACANGACLFNSFSLLLTGRDTYNAIIRHVLCNYICNPIKQILIPIFPHILQNREGVCNWSKYAYIYNFGYRG